VRLQKIKSFHFRHILEKAGSTTGFGINTLDKKRSIYLRLGGSKDSVLGGVFSLRKIRPASLILC